MLLQRNGTLPSRFARRSRFGPGSIVSLDADDLPRRRPEQDQFCDQLRHRRHRHRHALSFVARHRFWQSHRRPQSAVAVADPDCGSAGDRRLCKSHLLRSVRAAYDRQAQNSAAGRRLCELHELYDRPLARRRDLDLRSGAVPRLLVLGPQRRRYRQDCLRNRNDVLAGQHVCARRRRSLCARRACPSSITCRRGSTA